ncbi:MAG: DUF4174 domain-containing protein [Pseudomonadota bacterium]
MRSLAFVIVGLIALPVWAADSALPEDTGLIRPADDSDLSEFLWKNRPVVLFADTPDDPRIQQQISALERDETVMLDRDVVVLTDTDPAARSALRTRYRPRGFQLLLVGKDGGVKLRKPFPQTVRELSRYIDKMPLREQEIRDRRGSD